MVMVIICSYAIVKTYRERKIIRKKEVLFCDEYVPYALMAVFILTIGLNIVILREDWQSISIVVEDMLKFWIGIAINIIACVYSAVKSGCYKRQYILIGKSFYSAIDGWRLPYFKIQAFFMERAISEGKVKVAIYTEGKKYNVVLTKSEYENIQYRMRTVIQNLAFVMENMSYRLEKIIKKFPYVAIVIDLLLFGTAFVIGKGHILLIVCACIITILAFTLDKVILQYNKSKRIKIFLIEQERKYGIIKF